MQRLQATQRQQERLEAERGRLAAELSVHEERERSLQARVDEGTREIRRQVNNFSIYSSLVYYNEYTPPLLTYRHSSLTTLPSPPLFTPSLHLPLQVNLAEGAADRTQEYEHERRRLEVRIVHGM
jgi:hypothetical protein